MPRQKSSRPPIERGIFLLTSPFIGLYAPSDNPEKISSSGTGAGVLAKPTIEVIPGVHKTCNRSPYEKRQKT